MDNVWSGDKQFFHCTAFFQVIGSTVALQFLILITTMEPPKMDTLGMSILSIVQRFYLLRR